MKKVLIFGDSILRPIVMDDKGKYIISKGVDWESLERAFDIKITNYSKMGCTTEKGLKTVSQALEKIEENEEIVAIIEYGGNDSDYNWQMVSEIRSKSHKPFVEIEQFERNLIKIIEKLKGKGAEVFIMNLPPIDSKKYYNKFSEKLPNKDNLMYFLGDRNVIYRRQEAYSSIIEKIAVKENVQLINVRKAFLLSEDFPNLMCDDGIHPNEMGEKLIVDVFINSFLANKNKAV